MKAVYLKDKTGNKVVTTPYYRIGDLFLTTIAENPSSYLGGTWELFGPGRTLVCVDTSQTEFNSVKKTGGSKYLQKHYHDIRYNSPDGSGVVISHTKDDKGVLSIDSWSWATNEGELLGSGSNLYACNMGDGNSENLQPFITCYIWIRTA